MKCVVCRNGETKKGHATVTIEHGTTTVVVLRVPALVCENCGEEYVDSTEAGRLEVLAGQAATRGTPVSVVEYRAA
jgi:YgiT-type zinc finger domain-containing protein